MSDEIKFFKKSAEALGEELKAKFSGTRISSDILGLCRKCSHLMAFQTQYGKIHAQCEEFKKVLNASDPIIQCTWFNEEGQLSLWDMKEMATYIVVDGHPIGFTNNNEEEDI
jgi:hypothetical protein